MKGETNKNTGAHQRIRVLIADDSAVFRKAFGLFLERLPQVEVVGVAEDGEHALTLVASLRPDLVLMDMNMPRLNGLQATRKIRAAFPEVRVIMITFHDSEELKAASVAAGADRFIPKLSLRDELPGALAQLFPGRLGGAAMTATKVITPARTPLPASAGQSSSPAEGRSLIHLPIIHTQADMGALSDAIKKMTIQKLGQQGWDRNVQLIDEIWTRIEEAIDSWALPYERVRLYQDGMPICGREVEIVTELAKVGSRNHRLLLRLMEKGATLMGTESAPLLVQEYKLVKEIVAAGDSPKAVRLEARYKTLSRSLLKQRDQAIAERINTTLLPGETGLLFLGMLHAAGGWLAKDIRVTQPVFPRLGSEDQKP